jgi:hypothetical protein
VCTMGRAALLPTFLVARMVLILTAYKKLELLVF